MALNIPLFKALAPEFAATDLTTLNLISVEAERMVNVNVWLTKTDMGVVYMTAHMLKMAQRAGLGGNVTMTKVGDLQRSFSSGQQDDELDQTAYGKEFKRVRRSLQISPFLVT